MYRKEHELYDYHFNPETMKNKSKEDYIETLATLKSRMESNEKQDAIYKRPSIVKDKPEQPDGDPSEKIKE